jgi:hypothetical protein
VARNAVFQTFEKELAGAGANALKPLERLEVSDGMAMPDEVVRIVANRSGVMLSASTILKSDFFSNLQKMSLPEYVRHPYLNLACAHIFFILVPTSLHMFIVPVVNELW